MKRLFLIVVCSALSSCSQGQTCSPSGLRASADRLLEVSSWAIQDSSVIKNPAYYSDLLVTQASMELDRLQTCLNLPDPESYTPEAVSTIAELAHSVSDKVDSFTGFIQSATISVKSAAESAAEALTGE